jgi:uncharacterized protein (TIGR00369 family)
MSRLTGMQLVDVGTGAATFEMPLTEWLCSPQGAISIGPLTMPADAAMACAIQSTLPAQTPFTTSELSLRLLGRARPGGTVIAQGGLIQARRTIALADVSLTDEHGRLIAHGSSLCFVQRAGAPTPAVTGDTGQSPAAVDVSESRLGESESPGDVSESRLGESESPGDESESPDPWQRPAAGEILPQDVWERMSGLDVLHAQLAGELPPPPIHYLTGLTLMSASEGEAAFELPASEWLCAPPRGRAQGGTVALAAEAALSAAIQTRLPAGVTLAPVDLKVNYLRPLAADGRVAIARGRLVHAGRRIAVAGAEVLDADGRAVAVATGSAMLLTGRPASLGALGDGVQAADGSGT